MTNSHKNIINPFLESSTLLIMTFPEIVESKDLLWGKNMCSRQCTCQKKRSTWQTVWNANFTWKGSSQFPEIFQLFWHGICSALEYGQEIARIIVPLNPIKPHYIWIIFSMKLNGSTWFHHVQLEASWACSHLWAFGTPWASHRTAMWKSSSDVPWRQATLEQGFIRS